MDVGREVVGVALGVLLGVDDALSTPTRDFLDEDRGVTLLLRKGLTGVLSSRAAVLTLGVDALAPRTVRVPCWVFVEAGVAAAARRGVMGVLAVRLLARVGFNGHDVCGVDRSTGIVDGGSTDYRRAMGGMRRTGMAGRNGSRADAERRWCWRRRVGAARVK